MIKGRWLFNSFLIFANEATLSDVLAVKLKASKLPEIYAWNLEKLAPPPLE